MKKNVRIINYLLSIGLILLVMVFIISLMTISRFVLSDVTPVGIHVLNTKNLLQDINDVEKAASISSNLTSKLKGDSFNFIGFNVTDIAYVNVNKNKSIVTMFFDREIGNIGNVYYVKIKNPDIIQKGEILIYENEGIQIGEFVAITDGKELIVNNLEDDRVEQILGINLIGSVFYKAND